MEDKRLKLYLKSIRSTTIDNLKDIKSHSKAHIGFENCSTNNPVKNLIIYFPGGGYYLPASLKDQKICAYLSKTLQADVYIYQYPLAPDYIFPNVIYKSHQDLQNFIKVKNKLYNQVFLIGVSSGGNLVSSLSANYDYSKLSGIILISPSIDYYKQDYDSKIKYDQYDLKKETRAFFKEQYLNTLTPNKDPLLSPIYSENLRNFPKSMIHISGYDPLKDEGICFHKKLLENSCESTLMVHDKAIHNYFTYKINPYFGLSIESIKKFIS